MEIEIDFDVFKQLTSRRESESHSYNDVLRDLLGLPERSGKIEVLHAYPADERDGRSLGGRFLPNGTELRATYKHRPYRAEIVNGRLEDSEGVAHDSASAAARAITNTNVNGLTFWEVKRPGDTTWQKLVSLSKAPK